ncbi:rhomboid family intramembrane serine protease [Candidatus Pacearchaeota archaeon]|nr:rhomboid family intramembrane serine protease [Candidatus Pacearchaeota archaeon]
MPVYKIHRKKSLFSGLSVNAVLILVNVVFFVLALTLISFGVMNMDYVALKPTAIFQGQYLWTFLTSMFMHGGFLHLFVNMFSLFFVGSLTEKILGAKRYLWFYLLAGLLAGGFFVLSEFLFPTAPDIAAVGASGALFGVIGLLMLLTPNLPIYIMFIPTPIKMKYAAPGMLIVLWLISAAPMAFGAERILIGNTAHLGGLIAGIIYGLYLRQKFPRKTKMLSTYFR